MIALRALWIMRKPVDHMLQMSSMTANIAKRKSTSNNLKTHRASRRVIGLAIFAVGTFLNHSPALAAWRVNRRRLLVHFADKWRPRRGHVDHFRRFIPELMAVEHVDVGLEEIFLRWSVDWKVFAEVFGAAGWVEAEKDASWSLNVADLRLEEEIVG